jgi:hypothetical protein
MSMTLLLALLGTGLAASSSPAGAAANGDFGVAPATTPGNPTQRPLFQFSANPGATITDQVSIANFTTAPINFLFYAADGFNAQNGGAFALKLPNEPQTGVGAWTHLPVQLLTVPGRTTASFPFTIVVPPNATPGDHAGGIVAENTVPSQAQNGPVRVGTFRGVGARIYFRVNGPIRPGLGVTNAATSSSIGPLSFVTGSGRGNVHFKLLNTGNESLDVVTTVNAVDTFGNTIKNYSPIHIGPLLPGASVTLTEPKINLPRIGKVSYHITASAPGVKATGGVTQWIIPWVLVAIIVVLILAIAFWRWRRRRHRQPPRPPEPQPEKVVVG